MVERGNFTGDMEFPLLLPFAEEDREQRTTFPLGRLILSVAKWHLNSGEISDLVSSLFSLFLIKGVLRLF